jgi:hypothetical protein
VAKRKKQKSNWLSFLLAIGFFIALLALLLYGMKYFESGSFPHESKKIVVTSETLNRMYSQNEAKTNAQLNAALIEIIGSVNSISPSDSNTITVGSKSNPKGLTTQLILNPDSKNLSLFLDLGDQISADCTGAKENGDTPSLSNCTLKSIVTPVYGQGTDSQLGLAKNYTGYNGQSFNTQFLMGIPQSIVFNARISCNPKNISLTDIFVLKKNATGIDEMTNIANLDTQNVAQKKVVETDNQIKQMLQTLLNSKNAQNAAINTYINQVCSLPAS